MVLTVVTHELLRQGTADIDFWVTIELRTIYALAKVQLLFLRLYTFEKPSLVHSKVYFV